MRKNLGSKISTVPLKDRQRPHEVKWYKKCESRSTKVWKNRILGYNLQKKDTYLSLYTNLYHGQEASPVVRDFTISGSSCNNLFLWPHYCFLALFFYLLACTPKAGWWDEDSSPGLNTYRTNSPTWISKDSNLKIV